MTTAGIYNYHVKVEHPRSILPQMTSNAVQPPFFFGGSQTPVNLGIHMEGKGLHKSHTSTVLDELEHIPISQTSKGAIGLGMLHKQKSNISLPKHFKR